MIPLTRRAAEELTLAAVLCPLMVADVSTPLHESIFASDASEHRGAVLEAEVDPLVNEVLFKAFKTKGAYTRLQTPEEVLTQRLGIAEAEEDERPVTTSSVDRPLAYRFDFVELFAGAAIKSQATWKAYRHQHLRPHRAFLVRGVQSEVASRSELGGLSHHKQAHQGTDGGATLYHFFDYEKTSPEES